MNLYLYIYNITIFSICIIIINARLKKMLFLIMFFNCIFLNLLYNLKFKIKRKMSKIMKTIFILQLI